MITFNWIEKQMVFLTSRLGIYRITPQDKFFFEPTPGFYGFICQGTTDCLNEAMKILGNHIEVKNVPIIEDWKGPEHPLISVDYDWKENKQPPGLIRYPGSGRSRIEINVANKHSPLIMGAILAHELAHHFLDSKGIHLSDQDENEKLTDLATSYIGLGKLTLNGYDPITWTQQNKNGSVTWTYRVGYLLSEDMAAILHQTSLFRNIPLSITRTNLSDNSWKLIDGIQKEAEDYNLKKKLVGEQQCHHCEKHVIFSFSRQDDGLYCSHCNWEYSDGLKFRNNPWRKLFRKVLMHR